MRPDPKLLFIVILIEGYVVLASELLAIRQLIPFVGSGTEIVAILVSAVLLPLAIGYHHGGKKRCHVRAQLIRNILIALGVLSVALSYPTLEIFFTALNRIGIGQPIAQTTVYASLFLVLPIYLLGQTVPLVSNYLARARIGELTGRMLFYSTIGSFFGSVFSTLVLMNWLGVHATVIITLVLLAALVPIISRRGMCTATLVALGIIGFVFIANSPATMRAYRIVSDNAYNTVSIYDNPITNDRHLIINRSNSSALSTTGETPFPHVRYIHTNFIAPISTPASTPRKLLILGAGGFTVGLDDSINHYTFVDIDPKLKTIAENHLLGKKLGANKTFVAASARSFIHRSHERYDLIFIDTFTNVFSAPMETVTREFLQAAKQRLTPNGILIVNQIASPNMSDRFSLRYDRTFASVFGRYTRQVIGEHNPWVASSSNKQRDNILYIYYNNIDATDRAIYSDNLNRFSLDRNHP